MPSQLDRKHHAQQKHCYTCGKKFDRVKFECPVCGEWSCSDECRQKHIETTFGPSPPPFALTKSQG